MATVPSLRLGDGRQPTGALPRRLLFLAPLMTRSCARSATGITAKDVLRERSLIAAFTDDAFADNAPLFATLSRSHLDQQMLADLAKAYNEGRLLLIGTSDLDAQQGVIWHIGAIAAASDHPRAR